MYIIIIGGGRLGTFLAKRLLAEKHTVVIIEKEQEVAQDIARDLNVVMIHGDGCDPKILEQAGIVGPRLCGKAKTRTTMSE